MMRCLWQIRKKLQKIIDKLNDTCEEYGMNINVRKVMHPCGLLSASSPPTSITFVVLVVGGDEAESGAQGCITLDIVPLEHVARFKYLGRWILDGARCEEDIRARVKL